MFVTQRHHFQHPWEEPGTGEDSRPGPVLLTFLPLSLRSIPSSTVPKPAMKTMEETLILLSALPPRYSSLETASRISKPRLRTQ